MGRKPLNIKPGRTKFGKIIKTGGRLALVLTSAGCMSAGVPREHAGTPIHLTPQIQNQLRVEYGGMRGGVKERWIPGRRGTERTRTETSGALTKTTTSRTDIDYGRAHQDLYRRWIELGISGGQLGEVRGRPVFHGFDIRREIERRTTRGFTHTTTYTDVQTRIGNVTNETSIVTPIGVATRNVVERRRTLLDYYLQGQFGIGPREVDTRVILGLKDFELAKTGKESVHRTVPRIGGEVSWRENFQLLGRPIKLRPQFMALYEPGGTLDRLSRYGFKVEVSTPIGRHGEIAVNGNRRPDSQTIEEIEAAGGQVKKVRQGWDAFINLGFDERAIRRAEQEQLAQLGFGFRRTGLGDIQFKLGKRYGDGTREVWFGRELMGGMDLNLSTRGGSKLTFSSEIGDRKAWMAAINVEPSAKDVGNLARGAWNGISSAFGVSVDGVSKAFNWIGSQCKKKSKVEESARPEVRAPESTEREGYQPPAREAPKKKAEPEPKKEEKQPVFKSKDAMRQWHALNNKEFWRSREAYELGILIKDLEPQAPTDPEKQRSLDRARQRLGEIAEELTELRTRIKNLSKRGELKR